MRFSPSSRGFRGTIVCLLAALACGSAPAVTIDWVTVGDPGNAADTTGYGGVSDASKIGKCEVTIGQYTEFLNAVDPNGNVRELNDLTGAADSSRGLRGNSRADTNVSALQPSFRLSVSSTDEGPGIGFRLAAVREPATRPSPASPPAAS